MGAFGSTLAAIEVATWLFAMALPLGLFAWCRVALLTSRLIEPGSVVMTGLGLSALLYVLSDVYGYLSGNLVSELMSLGLSGAALWALLASMRAGGAALAMLSGLLAFAGYTMRVESVWAEAKPAIEIGETVPSVPPQIMASTLPKRIRFTPSMNEWPADEQAETTP